MRQGLVSPVDTCPQSVRNHSQTTTCSNLCQLCVDQAHRPVLALMVESSEQVANLRSEGLKAMPRTASL